ncbi:LacI family DNA-binding transcriptional regulator [Bacillus alkalicellulosilyticus]|uniref:LacI family DNA-binding transcriptional regulator n=1 Tax=Alkalihalobacterium alkalicellulosilyticum TaxID=1912214 RepID=UPI0009972E04|nr:LacI family DNA-binding transcriptional regulator [Bacillus alkalicellulosilyticus]
MRSEDLAKLLGVSRSTISRVINNYPDIPQATREKVWKAIEEYNYVPNASARKLAGVRNNMIAIVVLDVKEEGVPHHLKTTEATLIYDNPFFSPVINAVSDQANKLDYYVLISIVYSKEDLKKVEKLFSQKMIDGAIFVGTQETENNLIFKLIEQKYLIALIDTSEIHNNNHNAIYVNADNYEGSCKAISYLIELGHKRIGMITGNINKLSAKDRLQGYKDTLIKNGLQIEKELIYYGDFIERSGYSGAKQMLDKPNRPTALFVSNDTMALGVYKAAEELGLNIPEDISVIGFDNAIFSQYLSPPLTTINMPLVELAKRASTLLIESIEQNEQRGIIEKIEATLIKRQSCQHVDND